MSETSVKTYPATSETLELQFPFQYESKEITHLTFRRPKVRDQLIATKMKDAQGNKAENADIEISFMALLSEQEKELIEHLDLADYSEAQKILENFQKPKEGLAKGSSKKDL